MLKSTATLFALFLSFAVLFGAGDDPPGVVYLPGAKVPAGKLDDEHKIVLQVKYGNRPAIIVHREGSSPAEWHDVGTHLMVVQSGEGTLILGGEMVDRKPDPRTKGKEIGTSIRNGIEYKLKPGDVVYIPAKTLHQYVIQPGKQLTHFTINE